MTITKAVLIAFLICVALITGYIARRQAGRRIKPDFLELLLCILTGAIIFAVIGAVSWFH